MGIGRDGVVREKLLPHHLWDIGISFYLLLPIDWG